MIYCQKKSSIHKIVKNEKEIHVSFSVIPQTAEVMGTVHDNCFVKMEMATKWVLGLPLVFFSDDVFSLALMFLLQWTTNRAKWK